VNPTLSRRAAADDNGRMSSVDLVAAARRRPRVVDSLIAALVAGACALILTGRTGATVTPASPLDWLSIVVVAAPLIWRRRAPVLVFWTVALLYWGSAGVGAQSPAGIIIPLTALHAVARYRPPVWALTATCFIVPPGFAARLDHSQSWGSIFALVTISVAVMVIGLSQRTRQAYLAALEDRADRLERDRDQQARLAVADERARIAREMHDIVAHHLTVMTALSEGAAATAPTDPSRAATVMALAAATGREALAEMRRLVGVLRSPVAPDRPAILAPSLSRATGTVPSPDPPSARRAGADPTGADPVSAELMPQPGLHDLDALVDRVRAAGLHVTVTRAGVPGRWGPGAGLAIYRILQEALTNTLKHAGPKARAEVGLSFRADRAELDIRDDGAGRVASGAGSAGRHGLIGMAERTAAYGGEVTAGPRGGLAGWRVHARLNFGELPSGAPGGSADSEAGARSPADPEAGPRRAADPEARPADPEAGPRGAAERQARPGYEAGRDARSLPAREGRR
jgi:signal transduction histidine kinase